MKIGIVADDLTGAADSTAPFASRGMQCGVAFSDALTTPLLFTGYDVIALSTETRDVSGSHRNTIHSAVATAVRALDLIGPPEILCKKIDSTLRGALTVELNAICAEAVRRTPIICPAFPLLGRVVMGGTLFVNGQRRQQVRHAFGPDFYLNSEHLDLRGIHRGAEWVCKWLDRKDGSRVSAVFFDAQTDIDLETVASALLQEPERWVPVGSAGFLGAIAAIIGKERFEDPRCAESRRKLTSNPVLYICGSRTSLGREQIAELERASGTLRVTTVHDALQKLGAGSRIAVAASSDLEQDHDGVLENLLTSIDELLSISLVSLVATGGATAAAAIRRWMEFSHLDVLGEIEPGVVVTKAVFRTSQLTDMLACYTQFVDMDLILKAGGFGDSRTLARIAGL